MLTPVDAVPPADVTKPWVYCRSQVTVDDRRIYHVPPLLAYGIAVDRCPAYGTLPRVRPSVDVERSDA